MALKLYFTLALFLLINTYFCDGLQEGQETSAVVVWGSVFCDTCSHHTLHSPTTYFITDAIVAVECSLNRKARASIRVEGRTDESGEFRIELPSSIYNTYSGCSVELINSPDGSCNVPSVGKLALTLNGQQSATVYGAGHLSYRPQLTPSACFVKDEDSEKFISYVRGREVLESDETSKQTTLSPPSIPNLFPPLPPMNIPNAPPLPSIPPFPKMSVPPLPSIPPFPKMSAPPLPSIPPFPKMSVPPLPSIPPRPTFSFPPLPNIPMAKPPPFPLNFPPLPFFAPPPSK